MTDGIDKNLLYGKFQEQRDKQNKLALTAAHKALDIPEEMNVNATSTRTGIGPAGVVAVAVTTCLAAVIGGWLMAQKSLMVFPEKPAAQEWQILWSVDENGKVKTTVLPIK